MSDGLPLRARRSLSDRLLAALGALADHRGVVLQHSENAWASITFAGARHRVTMLFDGAEAVAAAEILIADLPEHEFTLPRHFVAQASVVEVDHRLYPAPAMTLVCELLVLEEG